jgi:hypothetical protein
VGFYKAGKQQVDWEKRYQAVSNAVVEKYKPLPSFQEYMLGGHEVVVDMVSLAAATYAGNIVAPGVGTGLALGATWMDHQAEMERTLIYDHGMKPVDAKLWTGIAAAPYAAIEYAELKGFSDFSFRGLETANRSLNRSIPNLFMTYFPQYLKRAGVGTFKETGGEVLQGAVDFALKETVRNMYETEGLTFDGNAKAFWDEAVGAVKYMWMAGLVGGQVTGAMQGTADVLRGGGVKGFFAPEFKMAVRDRTLPLEEFEAEVGLRRARTDATRLRAESGFKDGVPENVLDLVRGTRGDDVSPEVDIESEISAMGYENPAAVVEMAHAELDVRDKTREVIQSKINTLDRMMDAERGQDEFVVPKNGPKFGMVELAMNGWASGLDVALDVVATPEDFSQKYGTGEGVAVKAANMRKTAGGWQVVLVDSMLKSNADAYAQFRHEVLGHVGFDLSKNGPEVVGRVAGLVGLDYIKSRLPQYAKLHEAGKLTDAGLVEEFLAVLAGDLRRASVSDADKGMLEKLKEGFVRSLGVESAGAMTAREVVDLARQVMGEAFKAGSIQKTDSSGSQRAYDEQQKSAGKDLKKRKAAAEKQIQALADGNPVIKMVQENGGVQMPAGKESTWPEEYRAIPKRFRGKKGAGLPLDELADQAAALKGTTADYSTSEFRAELEAFAAKAERILADAEQGTGIKGQESEEAELIRKVEAGEISQQEFDQAMAELTGARFLVDGNTELKPVEVPAGRVDKVEFNRIYKSYQKAAPEQNTDTGWLLRFNKDGRDHTLNSLMDSGNPDALNLVHVLPQIARDAVLIYSHPDRKGGPDIERVHRFFAPAVISGELYRVRMTAKKIVGDDVRKIFSTSVEGIEKAVGISGPASNESEVGDQPSTAFSTVKVDQLMSDYKDEENGFDYARDFGTQPRFSIEAAALAGVDLLREEGQLSDERGQGAASADADGTRRMFPGLSLQDVNGGRGRQKLGKIKGFVRTEKVADTGFTRVYTGTWPGETEQIFEPVTWNGVDAWVRQSFADGLGEALNIAGHAHNYFLWNTRNPSVKAHEGIAYNKELIPEEPMPNAADKRRALARIEEFAKSPSESAHTSDLRFSVEQQEDQRRAVVIDLARQMMEEQEKGIIKSKITKATVQSAMISVGVRSDKATAADDLARVKEIVGQVRAQRSMGGNLKRLISQAEIDTHYGRQLEKAHQMGERGGKIWQQARDEVSARRAERSKFARQLAVGFISGELDDKNHIDMEKLWEKLIIEERVRKPRRAKETEKGYGKRPAATPFPGDLKLDITNDEYALEIRDWLYEVRRSVYRQLLFNKAPVPTDFQKAWKDPIVKAEYMRTVENLLREKVSELTFGVERTRLEERIARLAERPVWKEIKKPDGTKERVKVISAYSQLDAYENAVAGIMDEMFNTAVDQNRQEWISQAWTELERVKGAIKSRQSKYTRQLSGRAELMFRDVKAVMALDEEALNTGIDTILEQLGDVKNLDDQQTLRDRLSLLNRFGGLEYKKVGEIAEAVTWLHDTMAEELEKQQEVVERRKAAANDWKSTILDSLPKKRIDPEGVAGGVRNMFTRAMPVKLRLRDLVRYGAPAAVAKARAQVEDYSSRLADANTRKELEDNKNLHWMKSTLLALYETEDAGAVWHDLVRSRDEYAQYSDDGLPLSKTQLMQLVATFTQADYAKKAQMVLKYEATISALAAEMGIVLADLKGTHAVAYSGMDITKELALRAELDPFQAGQLLYAAVEEGSRLGRQYKTALAVIDDGVLTDADLALINKLRQFYAQSRPSLSAVLEEITGMPIPTNMDPNYVPVKKKYEKGGINGGGQRMPVTPAGLSRRVENFRSFDESADILSLWHSRMQENSQFKNFGSLYQDLGVLFNDPDVLHKARVTHGEKFVDGLTGHLTDIMSGKPATVKSDSLGATLVNLKAFTALGFNMSLFPRQWIGGLPSFGYFVSAKEFAGYIADLTSEEGRAAFTMILNSDWAKSRRQTGNTQILNESMAKMDCFKILRKYKEYAMMPSMWGDSFSIATFGQGYYRAQRVEAAHRGLKTEEHIHEFAMNRLWEISNLSQQSGAVMNRSEWQRSGNWSDRAFGMFTSGPQQQMSFQVDAYREWKSIQDDPKRKAAALKQFAKVGFINHVLVPLGYNGIKIMINALLRAGFDEDDAKELLISMVMGPYGGLYIGGTVLQTMADTLVNGEQFFKPDFTPVSGFLQDAELMALAARSIGTLEFSELPKIFNDALKNNFAPYRDASKIWENYVE